MFAFRCFKPKNGTLGEESEVSFIDKRKTISIKYRSHELIFRGFFVIDLFKVNHEANFRFFINFDLLLINSKL